MMYIVKRVKPANIKHETVGINTINKRGDPNNFG